MTSELSPDYDASDELEFGINWLPRILRGVYPPTRLSAGITRLLRSVAPVSHAEICVQRGLFEPKAATSTVALVLVGERWIGVHGAPGSKDSMDLLRRHISAMVLVIAVRVSGGCTGSPSSPGSFHRRARRKRSQNQSGGVRTHRSDVVRFVPVRESGTIGWRCEHGCSD